MREPQEHKNVLRRKKDVDRDPERMVKDREKRRAFDRRREEEEEIFLV